MKKLFPLILFIFELALLLPSSMSFLSCEILLSQYQNRNTHNNWHKGQNEDKDVDGDKIINPLLKLPWYAAESFGKIFGPTSNNDGNDSDTLTSGLDLSVAPSSFDETTKRIRLDNDRYYFLSGEVDKLCYAEDCTFSDPFVSFQGRDRFVENLQNLGSFVTQYDVKPIDYKFIENDNKVNMKVMVKLQLNLPWNPILAWPWGVEYDIDPITFQVKRHVESWDIDPWEVGLFRFIFVCFSHIY